MDATASPRQVKERPIIFSAAMVRAILEGRKTQTRRVIRPSKLLEFLSEKAVIDFTQHSIAELESIRRLWRAVDHNENVPAYTFQPYYYVKNGRMFGGASHNAVGKSAHLASAIEVPCPYGQPGDRLWVREATIKIEEHGFKGPVYAASEDGAAMLDFGIRPSNDDASEVDTENVRVRPSIHMPRSYARILLEIVSVRVERLQDITDDDAKAEGARKMDVPPGSTWGMQNLWSMENPSNRDGCLFDARMAFANYFCKLHGRKVDGIHDSQPWNTNPWVWVIEFKRVDTHEQAA